MEIVSCQKPFRRAVSHPVEVNPSPSLKYEAGSVWLPAGILSFYQRTRWLYSARAQANPGFSRNHRLYQQTLVVPGQIRSIVVASPRRSPARSVCAVDGVAFVQKLAIAKDELSSAQIGRGQNQSQIATERRTFHLQPLSVVLWLVGVGRVLGQSSQFQLLEE